MSAPHSLISDAAATFDPRFGASLTIDLGALAANWQTLRSLAPTAEVAGVVKANAYGLGLERVVETLTRAGARTFFVAHVDEGVRTLGRAPAAAVYVLNGLAAGAAPDFAEHTLRPVLGSFEEIEEWSALARASGRRLPCAIHVDTGMNRLGLTVADAERLAACTEIRDALDVRLVISHLACADEPGHRLTPLQLERFRRVRPLFSGIPASLANSAGLLAGEAFHFDLVRPGIALYGGSVIAGATKPTRPVMILQARVIQVRDVPAGEPVGYGAARTLRRPSRIAILSVGYADGYHRIASSSDHATGGAVAVGGRLAPIVGRISMDLAAIDVTDIPGVARGSLVTLIGPDMPLDTAASGMRTIDYEVLTSLGQRYQRNYVEACPPTA